jgi:hypothetical protein
MTMQLVVRNVGHNSEPADGAQRSHVCSVWGAVWDHRCALTGQRLQLRPQHELECPACTGPDEPEDPVAQPSSIGFVIHQPWIS